jgi:SEC-C motif-containing protein
MLLPACPCGSGAPYAACCGPLHRGARDAVTAEELMRSRYAAYAVGDLGHLVRTWHPRTRPEPLTLDTARTWTGLTVLDVVGGGPGEETGEVEFEAVFERAGTLGRQYERSRFERRRGRWVYVDGAEP